MSGAKAAFVVDAPLTVNYGDGTAVFDSKVLESDKILLIKGAKSFFSPTDKAVSRSTCKSIAVLAVSRS